ncbi:MAG: T9SS type A sorting domain-containing protein [Bacteroidetes bacterium]|nr:T9SS type A sorting domain-containing protein [Bacteroidota bacterium]
MKKICLLWCMVMLLSVVKAQSPDIYGVTSRGGTYDAGVIFKTDAVGNNYQKLKDIVAYPQNAGLSLCKASDGNYYGYGVINSIYRIYKYDTLNMQAIAVADASFLNTFNQLDLWGFTAGANGKLYAVAYAGSSGYGGIFEFDVATKTVTLKYNFTGGVNGSNPRGKLFLASNGKMYGSTMYDGANNNGTFFEYDYINNVFTKKFDNGANHNGLWISEVAGNLYMILGTTNAFNQATYMGGMIKYNLSTSTPVFYTLADLAWPNTDAYITSYGFESAANGKLYASGRQSSSSFAMTTVLEYDPVANTLTENSPVAYNIIPFGNFRQSTNGKLYILGYSICASSPSDSVCLNLNVYEYDIAGTVLNTKASLNPYVDGVVKGYPYNPFCDGLLATSFSLYGGNKFIASINNSILLYDTQTNTVTKKAQQGRAFGAYPYGKPIVKNNQLFCNLRPSELAKQNFGAMFKFDLGNNQLTGIVPNTNGVGGNFLDLGGNRIMATFGLGHNTFRASVYDIATNTYTAIGQTNQISGDPSGYFISATDGYIYGTLPGNNGVYVLDSVSQSEYLVYQASNTLQGDWFGGLIQANNGKIYGITNDGGVFAKGIIYSLDINSFNVTKLIDFNGVSRGAYPDGQLVQAANGKIYGTTTMGGTYDKGVLYAFDINTGLIQKLVDFDGTNKGQTPNGYLQLLPGNIIMGMTKEGGAHGMGTMFTYNYATNTFTKKLDFDGVNNGASPDKCGFTFDCSAVPVPTAGADKSICNNAQVVLGGANNSALYSYIWTPTVSLTGVTAPNPTLTVNSPTATYVMSASCDQTHIIDTVKILSIAPQTPAICVVTVDSASLFNYIYWDKTPYTNVDSFLIYREVISGYYLRIGGVKYADLSQFKDSLQAIGPANGNPNVGTYRYKIQIKDSCGNLSALSPYHNSIYFVNNSGTFTWNTYNVEGQSLTPVTQFDLMRDNLSDGVWTFVGSVAGTQNVLNDPQYSVYMNTGRWRVEALGFNCTPLAKTAQVTQQVVRSKSNVKNNLGGITAVNQADLERNILLAPNPSHDFIRVSSGYDLKRIAVYSVIGTMVAEINCSKEHQAVVDLSMLAPGVYTVVTETASGKLTKRIVKE